MESAEKTTPRVTLVKLGENDRTESRSGPPLGCMYLAAVLRERLGASCRIVDARVLPGGDRAIGELIAGDSPDLVGLSAMTSDAVQLHRLGARIKARLPHTPLVVGGPHASADPEDVLSDGNLDFLVRGEGEETLSDLVDALRSGRSVESVPGIGYRRDGVATMTPARDFVADLDALPFPAWDLVDRRAYLAGKRPTAFYKSKRYMPVFTSRACPHRCIYCHRTFGESFRSRSPENVLAELRVLYHDHGVREFEVYDDCFNADRARCKEILRSFARSEMVDAWLQFPNGLRADRLDDETIALLKEARTLSLSLAVESASPRIQKLIRKNVRLDRLRAAASKLSGQGIIVHGFFMFGFPTETLEEMEATLRFALDLDIDTASFFIVNPFKNTELARMAGREGLRIDTSPSSFDYLRSTTNLSDASDRELSRMIRRSYLEFYSSGRRLRSLLRALSCCPGVVLDAPRLLLDRVLFIGIGKAGPRTGWPELARGWPRAR